MFFGTQIPGNNTSWDQMRAVAEVMDAGPWHSAWTFDHFVPPLAFMDETGDCLEGWITLAGMAAATSRLQLGTIVSGVTYRNPALLAKMTATLDHMTGGRAILGIGAGWHEREHRAYGWDFPSLRERSDRLEEACALIRALFSAEGPVDYAGKYYQLESAPFAPRRGGERRIPIMVGGGGEKRTLRTLAKYGDIMNAGASPDDLRHKIEVLHQHCAEVGRDPAEITTTTFVVVALQDDEAKADRLRQTFGGHLSEADRRRDLAIGSAGHIIDVLHRYEEAGADGVIFQSIPNNPRLYERLGAEVLEPFAKTT